MSFSRINSNTLGTIIPTEETSTSYGKTVDEMQNSTDNTEKVAVNTSIIPNEESNTKKEESKTTTKKY